jgi:hypothetical protein
LAVRDLRRHPLARKTRQFFRLHRQTDDRNTVRLSVLI